eukprot:m.236364 g.236364  ORF g.236364 m.236364 type:complete len:57 (+) comp26545_c1_seq8:2759-2929(+)
MLPWIASSTRDNKTWCHCNYGFKLNFMASWFVLCQECICLGEGYSLVFVWESVFWI